MKVLIGLACVAVIAFVGYYFWGEWQKVEASRTAASCDAVAEGQRPEGMTDAQLDECFHQMLSPQ